MGFVISKILMMLILPPAGPLIFAAAGFAVIRRYRRAGRVLIISGFAALYLLSIRPVSDVLMRHLEKSSPPLKTMAVKAHAVVVLSGGVRDLAWRDLSPEPSELSLERLIAGVQLSRALRIPLILSGGSGNPSNSEISEAEAMARVAASIGVPHKDIVLESTSRNTIESARALRKILAGRRIILVTSAFHMKRASAMFKAQGLEILPAPAGYTTEQRGPSLFFLFPTAGNLHVSTMAMHEYLSYVWYKGRGDI